MVAFGSFTHLSEPLLRKESFTMRTWMFVAIVALSASSLARADSAESNRDSTTAHQSGTSTARSSFAHSNVSSERLMERRAGAVSMSPNQRIAQIADKSHSAIHH